ncbi:MAG: carboxypeptidase-like regulatory domain-containing protein, partial [Flavobacteriales bacterium]|nr:carboxypeptidase-like regulatory domain-containing protein [Flavobacteriales bacterium]
MKKLFFILSILLSVQGVYAYRTVKGRVVSKDGAPVYLANITLQGTKYNTATDNDGFFILDSIPEGAYQLIVFAFGYEQINRGIDFKNRDLDISIELSSIVKNLKEFEIKEERLNGFGIGYMNSVEGTAIYASKKNEVIYLEDIAGNKATNNSRQVYAKVSGLTIWESDGAGLQLGVGGRGLNPNRTTNFNTRQNGYDISADALGYPESYYTPPIEALERIEVIRGAASLQYGTQFGGVLNFKLKKGPRKKPIELTARQTAGSFGLLNSFVSVGGTKGTVNYYAFGQKKLGNGWRPNSKFNAATAHFNVNKQFTEKLNVGVEYTYMSYLAQQAGGLTDKQFDENARQSIRERNWFNVNWNLGAVL